MGRVVPFSDFDSCLDNLKNRSIDAKGTILDANVINDIALYTTVSTTQEYLEFYRRLLLTEGLRTALHPSAEVNIPDKERETIRRQKYNKF